MSKSKETKAVAEETKRPILTLADLGIGKDDVAEGLPTGGISFGSSTFIGPWMLQITYTTGTENDAAEEILKQETTDDIVLWPPLSKNSGGDWIFLSYDNFAAAKKAAELLNEEPRRPATAIRLAMDTGKVMNEANIDRLKENFGDVLHFDISMKALNFSEKYPAKNRHPFQQIALPGGIAAIAGAFGFTSVDFDVLKYLTGAEFKREDEEWSDSLYHLLVGDPVAGAFADVEVDWDDPQVAKIMIDRGEEAPEADEDGMVDVQTIMPLFSQARVAIWESLGEENFKAYTPSNATRPSGGASQTNVGADTDLDTCLRFISNPWSTPLYCRLTLVPDPRPEALSNAGNRLSIATITEVFGVGEQGENDAGDASADELDGQEVVNTKKPLFPAKPAGWASSAPAAILDYMRETDPGNAMPEEVAVQKLYMDTVELLTAWREVEVADRK